MSKSWTPQNWAKTIFHLWPCLAEWNRKQILYLYFLHCSPKGIFLIPICFTTASDHPFDCSQCLARSWGPDQDWMVSSFVVPIGSSIETFRSYEADVAKIGCNPLKSACRPWFFSSGKRFAVYSWHDDRITSLA